MRKYGIVPATNGADKPAPKPKSAPARSSNGGTGGTGVFLLLATNLILFAADHLVHLPWVRALYLSHAHPQWWQWLTHAFCHANWAHLSANLFNLCVFGKLVEETEGASGVVFTYCVTALGAALLSVWMQPGLRSAVSVGASGAVFGLFAVSVLSRLTWDPRRLLEAAILGQFVVRQVLSEARSQLAGGLSIGGLSVSHIAHLGGALAGVLLVLLLQRLPDGEGA